MPPRQRILTIRLSEKLAKHRSYAKSIGVKIINNKTQRRDTNVRNNF